MFKRYEGGRDDSEYDIDYSPRRSETLEAERSAKLTDAEVEEIFGDLGSLVADGYKYRAIRGLLCD